MNTAFSLSQKDFIDYIGTDYQLPRNKINLLQQFLKNKKIMDRPMMLEDYPISTQNLIKSKKMHNKKIGSTIKKHLEKTYPKIKLNYQYLLEYFPLITFISQLNNEYNFEQLSRNNKIIQQSREMIKSKLVELKNTTLNATIVPYDQYNDEDDAMDGSFQIQQKLTSTTQNL